MKTLTLISLFFFTIPLFANEGLNPKRERLFHCKNFGTPEQVEELFIVKSKMGTNVFYEVEVPYKVQKRQETFYRKLNFISKYDGRVLLFTTGNYRVNIDRAMPVEKKYKTFVRLPKFDIHSQDWFCKDY